MDLDSYQNQKKYAPSRIHLACQYGTSCPSDTTQLLTHRRARAGVRTVKETEEPGDDVVEECAIPMFSETPSIEFSQCQHPNFLRIVREYSNLFRTRPGVIKVSQHYIPTEGNLV